jgi:hypothetical protein
MSNIQLLCRLAIHYACGDELGLMTLIVLISSLLLAVPAYAARPLPALHDGAVVSGPGEFQQSALLNVTGHVILRNLKLQLEAPVRVAAGATLELDNVELMVSDPTGAANGTSNLVCEGPAHLIIRSSSMRVSGGAHPIWSLKGTLEVDGFDTHNSEIHLDHVDAQISRLNIFELEISRASKVTANHLNLVFLSTHTGDADNLHFADIPSEKPFDKEMELGSGARAKLSDVRAKIFLVYVHGGSQATLERMARVQLAIFPECSGTFHLAKGKTGTEADPAVFPAPGTSNCPFRITLKNVNVDTWDVYASDSADLTFDHSLIDELAANDHAKVTVRDSDLYADWLALAGDAELRVENSTVGALRIASQRPDLATSEIRLGGRSKAFFSHVRFDCGLVARGNARVEIQKQLSQPKYVHHSEEAVVTVSAEE